MLLFPLAAALLRREEEPHAFVDGALDLGVLGRKGKQQVVKVDIQTQRRFALVRGVLRDAHHHRMHQRRQHIQSGVAV